MNDGAAIELALFSLSQWAGHAATFRDTLRPEERDRAMRMHKPVEALRYTTSRGLLRAYLAERLRCPPNEVRFARDTFGKPRLLLPEGHAGLSFNMAQSGDWCLIACDKSAAAVGIDLQVIERPIDLSQLVQSYFSAAEAAEVEALSAADARRAFMQLWTVKEAFTKGVGHGMPASFPLLDFATVFPNGLKQIGPWDTVKVEHGSTEWEIKPLTFGEPFSAALACRSGATISYANSLASLVFGGAAHRATESASHHLQSAPQF